MTKKDNNILSISWLCECAGVSMSGYYNWISSKKSRNIKDEQDKKDFVIILAAYQFRSYDKGKRRIYMRLLNVEIRMNQKKISRIMNKFNLRCPMEKQTITEEWQRPKGLSFKYYRCLFKIVS